MSECKITLSAKGQIVIPAKIRKEMASKKLILKYENGTITIYPEKIETKMTDFVTKIKEMNKKYSKFSQEEIDVLSEIEAGGA